jgi:NADH:ubiquinone oxidoreductase subunit K
MPLTAFLLVALILFILGLFLVLTRRNAIMALMGIELMLNAANLNFIAFARQDPQAEGQIASLFVMALAAAETAVALAIILSVYRRYKTVHLDELRKLKG